MISGMKDRIDSQRPCLIQFSQSENGYVHLPWGLARPPDSVRYPAVQDPADCLLE